MAATGRQKPSRYLALIDVNKASWNVVLMSA
jgi:hypothetical protein